MTAYDSLSAAQEEYEREGDAYIVREKAWAEYGGDPLGDATRTFELTGAETLRTIQALYRAVDAYTTRGDLAGAGECRYTANRLIYTGKPVVIVPEVAKIQLAPVEAVRVAALIEGICGNEPFALSGEDVTALLALVPKLTAE